MSTFTDDLPSIVAGAKILASDIDTIVDALAALTGAWNDYSSSISWIGNSTNPSVGNATVASSYVRVGKLVMWQGSIFMGSTTTYGSGQWSIAWPVAPASYASSSALLTGSAFFYDSSDTNGRMGGVCVSNGSLGIQFYPGYKISSGFNGVSSSVPFTWASGDRLGWNITYPAA